MNNIAIFTAVYMYLVGLVIATVCFLRQSRERQKHLFFYGFISGSITFILSRLASPFYYDPRPFVVGHLVPLIPHAADNGFPSDHVLLMSAVTLALLPYSRKAASVLGFITVLIGIARVYVGVHHTIDIVGAMLISAISAVFVLKFITPKIAQAVWYKRLFTQKRQ